MDGYWSSPEGLARQHERRRWLRTMRAIVDLEPQAKSGRRDRHPRQFRDAVRGEVAGHPMWPRPRASLAIDLHFTTTRRQPPRIDRLPKNYLDLLGASHTPDGDPGPVLFSDDRAVGMLFVSCRHTWDPVDPPERPRISLTARTMADALTDLAVAGQVEHDHDDDSDDHSFRYREFADEEEHSWLRFMDQRGDPVSLLLAESSRFRRRASAQEQILRACDASLRNVFFHYPQILVTGGDPNMRRLDRLAGSAPHPQVAELARHHAATARRALTWIPQFELPPLPAAPGDTATFKSELAELCRRIVVEQPALFPLLVPIRITVLVIPPVRADAVIDLDNLLITIVREVDTHLRPPLDLPLGPDLAQLGTDTGSETTTRARHAARMKSLGATAVRAYQVIRLHREPADPERGRAMLILGDGHNHRSLWEEADDLLVKHFADPSDWPRRQLRP